jgi:hypothetical protein|tara:strand:+ start:2312 stop:2506 length:195 start_codon:yes stop_codon:yes gene_type:complete
MEENLKQHLGMVVEEDGQILIAFRPETIQFISDTLKIKDGDVVVIDDASDADNDSPIIIINKLQ